MATTKPRITITLNHRQYEVLKAISDCSNQPMSAFISELLEESLPVLERMAESFRKIKAAQDEQKKRIADELEQAQAGVEPILEQVLGQFDLFMTRVEAAPVSAAARTPVTNRGVTPSPSNPPKRPRRKASGDISHAKVSSKKSRG